MTQFKMRLILMYRSKLVSNFVRVQRKLCERASSSNLQHVTLIRRGSCFFADTSAGNILTVNSMSIADAEWKNQNRARVPEWMVSHFTTEEDSFTVKSILQPRSEDMEESFPKLLSLINTPAIFEILKSIDCEGQKEFNLYLSRYLQECLADCKDVESYFIHLLKNLNSSDTYMVELLLNFDYSNDHLFDFVSAIFKFATPFADSINRVYEVIISKRIEKFLTSNKIACTSNIQPWITESIEATLVHLVETYMRKNREPSLRHFLISVLMNRDFKLFNQYYLLRLLSSYIIFMGSQENISKYASPQNLEHCKKFCEHILGADFLISLKASNSGVDATDEPSSEAKSKTNIPRNGSDHNLIPILFIQSLLASDPNLISIFIKDIATIYKCIIKMKALHPKFVLSLDEYICQRNTYDSYGNRFLCLLLYNKFKFQFLNLKQNNIEIYSTLIKQNLTLSQLNSHQVLYILFSLRGYESLFSEYKSKNLEELKIDKNSQEIIKNMLRHCINIWSEKFLFWNFSCNMMILYELVLRFRALDGDFYKKLQANHYLWQMAIKERADISLIDIINFAAVFKTFMTTIDADAIEEWKQIFYVIEEKMKQPHTYSQPFVEKKLIRLFYRTDLFIQRKCSSSSQQNREALVKVFEGAHLRLLRRKINYV
jgi:hypothetical protein